MRRGGTGLFLLVQRHVAVIDFQAVDRQAGRVQATSDAPAILLRCPASAFGARLDLNRRKFDFHRVIPLSPQRSAGMMKHLRGVVPVVDIVFLNIKGSIGA